MLNCEGAFLPIGSGHRNPSVFSVFWRAWSSSFAPSLFSLTVDAACICGSTEPSGAEPSGAQRTEPEEGCCSPSCHPPLQLQSEEGTRSRRCLPAEVRAHKLRAARVHSCASAHTSAGLGHQRSSHGVILPRTESKDILDSGSKSQQANGEQQGVCTHPGEPRKIEETKPSCPCLKGTAGFYVGMESALISFCGGVCKMAM